jgi:hypothetical protein
MQQGMQGKPQEKRKGHIAQTRRMQRRRRRRKRRMQRRKLTCSYIEQSKYSSTVSRGVINLLLV